MVEKIWYEDILSFLTLENYYIVLPLQSQTIEEKLNAIARFFIYFGIIMALVRSNANHLLWGIVVLVITIIIYKNHKKTSDTISNFLKAQDVDVIDSSVCKRTTIDNPFMNPTVDEYGTKTDYNKACPITNEKIYNKINDNFTERMFQDCGDIYGKTASQRQFYTVPNTSIPNDQDGFAKWLYSTPPTCKEGNGFACMTQIFDDAQRRAGNGSHGIGS